MVDKRALHGLYVLTDAFLTPRETVLKQIERVLKSGVRIIQFRDKYATDEALETTCHALQQLCDRYSAIFIINDRLELALKINADGLHVGEDDASYEEARKRLGAEKIIGVSCYDDLQRAQKYALIGADYVAFGACFPSPTKPSAKVIDLAILQEAKKRLNVPICVIGGITQTTIKTLLPYGVDIYSLISAVYENDAIEDNINQLKKAIQ